MSQENVEMLISSHQHDMFIWTCCLPTTSISSLLLTPLLQILLSGSSTLWHIASVPPPLIYQRHDTVPYSCLVILVSEIPVPVYMDCSNQHDKLKVRITNQLLNSGSSTSVIKPFANWLMPTVWEWLRVIGHCSDNPGRQLAYLQAHGFHRPALWSYRIRRSPVVILQNASAPGGDFTKVAVAQC